MVYEGYLRVGGVEVVNTERARGYTRTSPCPVWWIDDTVACPGLAEAVGDQPYVYDNISEAPWYDRSLAALSSRFYGVVGLRIDGLSDSTRATSRTEGVTPGGSLGATRKGMRDVRVRATLIAEGLDALDYGSEWMSSAFDGGCGLHSSGCGLMDADMLTACPPIRGEVPDFTEWEETRRNLIANPAFRANTTNWSAAAGGGAAASIVRASTIPDGAVAGLNTPGAGYARLTYTTAGTWFRAAANTGAVTPGQEYTLSGWVRGAPTAGNFRLFIQWKTAGNSLIEEVQSTNVLLGSAFSRVSFTAVAPANAAYATVQLGRSGAVVGDFFDLTGVLFEKSATLQTYFDGNTPSSTNPVVQQRHTWAGTTDASSSVEESRYSIVRPRTPEEYALIVNALRRYVHDVAVTSGPITVATYKSKTGNFYSREVEFTITSERAWVYGMTKELTLAPSLPTVMEDTPYNRVQYPSAELSSGSIVIAQNLSTNPSVETNTTGWASLASTISGSSATPFLTAARSTELAAVGAASYRVRLLGDNGATPVVASVCDMVAYQDVAIPAGTGRRVSLNMWAAALVLAGAAPNTEIQTLNVRYLFLTSGGSAIGGTTVFGTAAAGELGGNAYSLTGLAVPATAAFVRVSVAARVVWTSSATAGQNSDIRLFADALQVSIP